MTRKQKRAPSLEDQEPHALLPESQEEDKEYRAGDRKFPFRPGAKPGSGNMRRAEDALAVFEVLHGAYQDGRLTFEQLQPLFFRSTSDLITYREGWKAGKFWSRAAWRAACKNGNTNGLVSEHVLPRSVALEHALALPIEQAKQFVWANSFECVITRDEDKRVNTVKEKYPHDPWTRYSQAGVKILDVHYPSGKPFLEDSDRHLLRRHRILVAR